MIQKLRKSILFPNEWDFYKIVDGIFTKSYMHLFGELFYEDYDAGEDRQCHQFQSRAEYEIHVKSSGGNLERCPDLSNLMKVLLFAYMFLGNVVLLNMLIAMMSNTYMVFTDINTNAHHRWYLKRLRITIQYLEKSAWIPPFNIISTIYRLIKCCPDVIHDEFRYVRI